MLLVAIFSTLHFTFAFGQPSTISVDLKLRTGGGLSGQVVDYTAHGLVVERGGVPFVFAWPELESGSAYQVRRALLDLQVGGRENYSAADYFQLGVFALSQERTNLASNDFASAMKLDNQYERRIAAAYDEYRRQRQERESSVTEDQGRDDRPTTEGAAERGLLERVQDRVEDLGDGSTVSTVSPELSAAVEEVYRSFGATVQRVISKNVVLVETEHFLIWTDWPKKYHSRLTEGVEPMYAALCAQWQVDPKTQVFLAKCPIFCFRAKSRYRDFARLFDGYDSRGSLGYTRSIEANGHTHVVVLRQGDEPADFDRFAATLVHEFSHAFLHRMYSTRLIPHWVNEGYADLMAERVLGDRCFTGENAVLLARQYARHGWPITKMLLYIGPIDVHEYPLAQSIIAFLESRDPRGFLGFLRGLKEGRSIEQSLADNYAGMSLTELETQWRSWAAGAETTSSAAPVGAVPLVP